MDFQKLNREQAVIELTRTAAALSFCFRVMTEDQLRCFDAYWKAEFSLLHETPNDQS
jgi:hypothetical protein